MLPQTDRGGVRLDQRVCRPRQGQAAGTGSGRCRLHPGACRLQPDPIAQAPGGTSMSLKGKWRIVETELWDSEFLDLMGHAYILFDGNGGGEFAFGCVTGQLHCRDTS